MLFLNVTKVICVYSLVALRRFHMKKTCLQNEYQHRQEDRQEELIHKIAFLEDEMNHTRESLLNGDYCAYNDNIDDPRRPWIEPYAIERQGCHCRQRYFPVNRDRKCKVNVSLDVTWGSLNYRGEDLFHKQLLNSTPCILYSNLLPVSIPCNPWFYCIEPTPRQTKSCTFGSIIFNY